MIKNTILIFSLTLVLCSCAYRATYFSPVANTKDDHSQRAQIYITRGNIKLEIWTQENSDSTWVMIYNTSISDPLRIKSKHFYIKSNDLLYEPINHPRVISKIGEIGGSLDMKINKEQILVIEFEKRIQKLDSFILHLPAIFDKNKTEITDLKSISFKKETKWRAISIN